MPETTLKVMDPLGVIAIANVLEVLGKPEPIGCPGNCGCNPMCGCENEPGCCENKCPCEKKQATDVLSTLTNPVFREVVQGLDMRTIKTTGDFLTIVDEIRTKLASSEPPIRSTDVNQP